MGCRQSSSSLFAMVVKTETCNYSGFKIYPGHGKKFVRSDQKMFTFITGKAMQCQLMKRRNLTTKWTVHYRRINKKGISADEAAKKRRSKAKTAVRRDISGLPMELLQKTKASRPAKNSTAKDAALKELKNRKAARK